MERLKYLDYAKGLAMIFVIFGHVVLTKSNEFRIWIYSFHMPLFFIISGCLLYNKYKKTDEMKIDIKKQFKNIMIPYLTFSFMNVIVQCIKAKIENTSIQSEFFGGIKSTFIGRRSKSYLVFNMFISCYIIILFNLFCNKKQIFKNVNYNCTIFYTIFIY